MNESARTLGVSLPLTVQSADRCATFEWGTTRCTTALKWGTDLMTRITCTWLLSIVAAFAVLTGTNQQRVQAQVGMPQPRPGSLVDWGYPLHPETNIPAGNDFVAIAGGHFHSLALRSNGSLVGWGDNSAGQTDVPAGNEFVAIAGGGFHSLALRSDGTLVAWGLNDDGQTDVPIGNGFVAIAAGRYHNLALRSNGSLVGWGYDAFGLTDVPAGHFVAIVCGAVHNLVLRSDGSLVSWGFSQLPVPAGNGFVAIAAGAFHNLALRSDGSLIAWGPDGHGETIVPAGNDFVAIAAGGGHCLARRSNGSLIGWGYNLFGQTNVPAGNDLVAIAAGMVHSLAIVSITPAQAIQNLIATIGNMGLPKGEATSLIATLKNINTDNKAAACAKIYAFITKVGVDLKRGALTPAQATQLLHAANAIADSLGCGP